MMIGLPGSGKSTWIRENFPDTIVASSDNYIESYAQSKGLTYNDVFKEAVKAGTQHAITVAKECIKNEQDLIWDQTNLTVKSRSSKLALIPSTYKKTAVYVITPDAAEHARRLNRPGKSIPDFILKSMNESIQVPTLEEGFDNIIVVVA